MNFLILRSFGCISLAAQNFYENNKRIEVYDICPNNSELEGGFDNILLVLWKQSPSLRAYSTSSGSFCLSRTMSDITLLRKFSAQKGDGSIVSIEMLDLSCPSLLCYLTGSLNRGETAGTRENNEIKVSLGNTEDNYRES